MNLSGFISLIFICAFSSLGFASEPSSSDVAASVNGEVISADTIEFLLSSQINVTAGSPVNSDNNPQSEIKLKEEIRQNLIDSEIMAQVAIQAGIHKTKEFEIKKRLQINNLYAQLYLSQYRENLIINEKSIKERYDALSSKYQYNTSRIKVDNIETGVAALEALKNGVDFAGVANQYSVDAVKAPGGVLGNMSEGQLASELWHSLILLKENDYTPNLIKVRRYWYLLKLNAKTLIPKRSYKRMRTRLENDIRQENLIAHVEAIRKNAKVVLFDLNNVNTRVTP